MSKDHESAKRSRGRSLVKTRQKTRFPNFSHGFAACTYAPKRKSAPWLVC